MGRRPLLYAVTEGFSGEGFFRKVAEALEGGVDILQYRDLGKHGRHAEIARRLRAICSDFGVPLAIDDEPWVARQAGADMLHLGIRSLTNTVSLWWSEGEARDCSGIRQGSDMLAFPGHDSRPVLCRHMPSLEEARAVVGNLPIGTSVYCSPVFAVEAQAHGYAYVSVGTPYMSVTKRIATVCSMQNLSEAVRAVRIPVYAVGGVNLKNAAEILETGVSGLVSVSAIFSANDVRGTVRKFIEVLEGFTVDRDPFPVGLVR